MSVNDTEIEIEFFSCVYISCDENWLLFMQYFIQAVLLIRFHYEKKNIDRMLEMGRRNSLCLCMV